MKGKRLTPGREPFPTIDLSRGYRMVGYINVLTSTHTRYSNLQSRRCRDSGAGTRRLSCPPQSLGVSHQGVWGVHALLHNQWLLR
jgi:hypothetical protein